MKMTSPWHHL